MAERGVEAEPLWALPSTPSASQGPHVLYPRPPDHSGLMDYLHGTLGRRAKFWIFWEPTQQAASLFLFSHHRRWVFS